MSALLEWLEAKEWRMFAAIIGGILLIAGLIAWAALADHERQCREKGTYTVCTRERFSHMTKIGDVYQAHYVCVEHEERPCETD